MTGQSAQPRLYLARRHRGDHTVITAVGTITESTVLQLRTMLLQALHGSDRSLLLDLSGVDRIDDAGLDALHRTGARARLLGGQVRLVAPSPPVAARLRDSGLTQRLPVSPTLTGALNGAVPGPDDSEAPSDAPEADWLEQHQTTTDTKEGEPGGELVDDPLPTDDLFIGGLTTESDPEADPADLIEQQQIVPLNEEDYPTRT